MNVGQYIKKLRLEKALTQEEVGAFVGVQRAAVQKWESGMTQNIKRNVLQKLAELFNVPAASFIAEIIVEPNDFPEFDVFSAPNIHPVQLKRFPLLGNIACGEPIWADEDKESYIMANGDIRADFCLIAQGDSMIGARILDGDIVFIKEQPLVCDGEIAAVIIGNEATLKRVYYNKEESELVLVAENPIFKTLRYAGEELNQIRILGKAVYFTSEVR